MNKGLKLVMGMWLMFLFGQVSAQDFYAGPIIGASFSQVDGDSYAGFNKAGFVIGGFAGRSLSDIWDVQMEIVYIQKGSRKTPDAENGDYSDYMIHLNYIQFPVLVRLKQKKFSIEGGICIGSLLGSREEEFGEPIVSQYIVPFKSTEWSWLCGVNYQITERLRVNGRFSYSLFRIRVPYNGDVNVYNPHWDQHKPGQYNDVISVAFYYDLFYRSR